MSNFGGTCVRAHGCIGGGALIEVKSSRHIEMLGRGRLTSRQFAGMMTASIGSICLLVGLSPSSADASPGVPALSSAGALSSRTMAGYTAGAPSSKKHLATVTATFVMPSITCPATGNSSIGVSVVISDASSVFAASAAGGSADATCTNGFSSSGVEAYEGLTGVVGAPSLVSAGDTVQISVSQTRSRLTATVRDMTRGGIGVSSSGKPRKNKKPVTVAVMAQGGSGASSTVASFGTVHLSKCLLDGSPLGAAAGLRSYNLVNSADQTEVATGPFDVSNAGFSETFVRAS